MWNRAAAAACCAAVSGCAGGAPLLHPAHVLRPGVASVGAGLSGDFVVLPRAAAGTAAGDLEDLTAAPGIAPWVAGRVGLDGSNEAGLTYTGRTVRVDGRHALSLGTPTLSVGLGAAAVLARRPGHGADGGSVYGGGLDAPVLLGFQSRSDVYSLWLGPRIGFELLRGRLQGDDIDPATGEVPLLDVSGQHLQLGFVLGFRAGFRHLHVALEAGAAYHHATGTIGDDSLVIDQATIAPGGGLIVTF
ncbi:MAG: hypothetical protein IT372_39680 [Polyangiaceae bacterium]|nr:hypothetical protein [Polyangiaceae bacterium]